MESTLQQEETINALVLAKRDRTPEALVRLSATDRDEIPHQDYLQADQSGVVLLLNLALQRLGAEGAAKVWTWQSGAILAKYDANTGATRITVGDLVALSNEVAGRERLIPGQWLYAIIDAYKAQQARAEAERRRASLLRADQQIGELTAEI